jgi:hypothetical protein
MASDAAAVAVAGAAPPGPAGRLRAARTPTRRPDAYGAAPDRLTEAAASRA